ncbi:MFS transporter [Pseudomonas putida]
MHAMCVQQRIESAAFNWFHVKVMFWCFLIIVVDGYDIAIAGAALPSIIQEMGVTAWTAGIMASSALVGMVFGAVFFGAIAERIGRKWALSICVLLFSVFTAAAGFTTDPVTFCVLRFLAGLGIGGVQPNIVAQMTEYSPKRSRSLLTTVMFSGYAIGGIIAAVLGKEFIVEFGWKIVFFAAGVPIILIPFILKFMPESLSVLVRRQDTQALRKIMAQLDPRAPNAPDQTFSLPALQADAGAPVAQLFKEGRAISTLMFWVAFFTGLFMIYSLSTWLTKLMAMSGYSIGSALSFVVALNIGAVGGCVIGGWLADRFRIKWVLVAMYSIGSVFLYLMTFKVSTEVLYLIVGVVGACTTGAQIVAYAYCGQFYPAGVRSTGIGIASGVGRMGAILAPILIGFIVALNLPLQQNFMIIAAAGMVGAIALAFINPRSATQAEGMQETSAEPSFSR